jgi:hypothetical protein
MAMATLSNLFTPAELERIPSAKGETERSVTRVSEDVLDEIGQVFVRPTFTKHVSISNAMSLIIDRAVAKKLRIHAV